MSKALELRPNWPLYLCSRGKQYMNMENWNRAIEDFDHVYEILDTLKVGNGLS